MSEAGRIIEDVLRNEGLDASEDVHSWRCFQQDTTSPQGFRALKGDCNCLSQLAELIIEALGIVTTVEWRIWDGTAERFYECGVSRPRLLDPGDARSSRTVASMPDICGPWVEHQQGESE